MKFCILEVTKLGYPRIIFDFFQVTVKKIFPKRNLIVLFCSFKARYLADLKHTYFPSFTKTNENLADNEDHQEKKLKWEKARQHEKYHEDLRKQIEEKQRIALEIAERERCQEAALTRRVEKQLQQLRMEHEDEKAKQAFEENVILFKFLFPKLFIQSIFHALQSPSLQFLQLNILIL